MQKASAENVKRKKILYNFGSGESCERNKKVCFSFQRVLLQFSLNLGQVHSPVQSRGKTQIAEKGGGIKLRSF